jgi:hypothetical protein
MRKDLEADAQWFGGVAKPFCYCLHLTNFGDHSALIAGLRVLRF